MAVISEFAAALNQICAEKGISRDSVLETIKLSLVSAYRKDFGGQLEDVTAEIDPDTGEAKILSGEKDVTPPFFGRIASQTAKQVLLQKLREAEKDAVISEMRKKVGTVISAHIFRVDKGNVIFDLGRCQGVMPPSEQISGENYQVNQRLKVLIKEIRENEALGRGPEVIVSRSDGKFVESLFTLEVPELNSGTVVIKNIAREAGSRTKMAVMSNDSRVDPVGSCVGQKGVRVQAVIAEINNEKIDIISYDENQDKFIAAALSPAKVRDVILYKKRGEAKVLVTPDQLSLAIGKDGQNVRLAAKLTGWKIDISGGDETSVTVGVAADSPDDTRDDLKILGNRIVGVLDKAGITTLGGLKDAYPEKLKEIKGLGERGLIEIKKLLGVEEKEPAPEQTEK